MNGVELRRNQHGSRAESHDAKEGRGKPGETRGKPGETRDETDEAEQKPGPWRGQGVRYTLALGFGLIHGLGFSNFLRAALGGESSIVWPLFAFNVGLEVGQIFIVAIVLAATALVTGPLRFPPRGWVLALSGTAGVMALYLLWERLPVG